MTGRTRAEIRADLGVAYCPTCEQDTLPDADGVCLWCEHRIDGGPVPRCIHGHALIGENARRVQGQCRRCRRESNTVRARTYRQRKKAA